VISRRLDGEEAEGTSMKLHYFDGSTACRPVVLFAADAGIPLDLVPVNLFAGEHKGEAYTALNPNQLVPLLEEPDGFRMTESSAILKYLADRAGHPAWPTEPRAGGGECPDGLVQHDLLPRLRLRLRLPADHPPCGMGG
jgi:hypothetical protein